MTLRAPSPTRPFTLTTLEDDDVTRLVRRLAEELVGRASVDAFGGELADPKLLALLEGDITDDLHEAILGYETSTAVVDGFAARRGARVP